MRIPAEPPFDLGMPSPHPIVLKNSFHRAHLLFLPRAKVRAWNLPFPPPPPLRARFRFPRCLPLLAAARPASRPAPRRRPPPQAPTRRARITRAEGRGGRLGGWMAERKEGVARARGQPAALAARHGCPAAGCRASDPPPIQTAESRRQAPGLPQASASAGASRRAGGGRTGTEPGLRAAAPPWRRGELPPAPALFFSGGRKVFNCARGCRVQIGIIKPQIAYVLTQQWQQFGRLLPFFPDLPEVGAEKSRRGRSPNAGKPMPEHVPTMFGGCRPGCRFDRFRSPAGFRLPFTVRFDGSRIGNPAASLPMPRAGGEIKERGNIYLIKYFHSRARVARTRETHVEQPLTPVDHLFNIRQHMLNNR